jgi:HEPN domain-containing protein
MKTDFQTQVVLNEFATRVFRNEADKDYIVARIAYRFAFDQQFLWSAEQAVEKYLKAILLYNATSAKRIRHSLRKALNRIRSIQNFDLRLPQHVTDFVEYLDDYGPDRYLEFPSHVPMHSLLELDRAAWFIRRYCYYMGGEIKKADGTVVDRRTAHLARLNALTVDDDPRQCRIVGGYLENVLARKLPSAPYLVWKNFFFGRVFRKRIPNFRLRGSAINPPQDMHEEWLEILEQFVDFPRRRIGAKTQ